MRDSVPDYQALMLPVLQASALGEQRIGDLVSRMAEDLDLSEDARTKLLASGRQTIFANRVHWAKTYLGKAGLIEATRRGHFCLTERGRQVLSANPERIDARFLSQFSEFRQFSERFTEPVGSESAYDPIEPVTQTPDEKMRHAHGQIDAALALELLDRIRAAPSDFFERLILSLLLAMGYGGPVGSDGHVIGGSGDGGLDVVVNQDLLGLDRVYVQAKRYAAGNGIGSSAIRDFFGGLDREKAAKGLFVTTSSFTKNAVETAQHLSKSIVLIDGERLARLMIQHNVGCLVEEVLHIKKLDENFFD